MEDNVFEQLLTVKHKLEDKRILDIGTRDGLNCYSLLYFGKKEVIGIDIDDSQFFKLEEYLDKMYPNKEKNEYSKKKFEYYKNNIKLIKVNLLDFVDDNKFDIITCFLWNMPFDNYDEIMLKIKSLLNTNGILYIGIHDYVYKDINSQLSVINLLEKYFNKVRIINNKDRFQWIIEATEPK